jgi:hypothetical protein
MIDYCIVSGIWVLFRNNMEMTIWCPSRRVEIEAPQSSLRKTVSSESRKLKISLILILDVLRWKFDSIMKANIC